MKSSAQGKTRHEQKFIFNTRAGRSYYSSSSACSRILKTILRHSSVYNFFWQIQLRKGQTSIIFYKDLPADQKSRAQPDSQDYKLNGFFRVNFKPTRSCWSHSKLNISHHLAKFQHRSSLSINNSKSKVTLASLNLPFGKGSACSIYVRTVIYFHISQKTAAQTFGVTLDSLRVVFHFSHSFPRMLLDTRGIYITSVCVLLCVH